MDGPPGCAMIPPLQVESLFTSIVSPALEITSAGRFERDTQEDETYRGLIVPERHCPSKSQYPDGHWLESVHGSHVDVSTLQTCDPQSDESTQPTHSLFALQTPPVQCVSSRHATHAPVGPQCGASAVVQSDTASHVSSGGMH